MHAQEKESYIRSAVEASPHKIAIISCKDHYEGKSDHITVAFYDANHNLVFAKVAPGAVYSGNIPEKTFGSAETSGVTIKALASDYQTIEAVPLDFLLRHGANADKAAELFKAGLEKELTGANSYNTTEEALQKTIERIDPSFGVNVKNIVEDMWGDFKADYPDAAEGFAKLLLKHVFGIQHVEGTATDTLTALMKSPGTDVILPKTFVMNALQSAWEDFREAYPEAAQTFAKNMVLEAKPEATDDFLSWTTQFNAAIPLIVDEVASSRESWARENSSRVYSPEHDTWVDAGKQPQELPLQTAAPNESQPSSDGSEELMGRRHHMQDHTDLIATAVDASPTGVVIIGVRGKPGSGGASVLDFQNEEKFDHVLVAYRDPVSKQILIAEMTPGNSQNPNDAAGMLFNSKNDPGTLHKIVRQWDSFTAVPVDLTPEQDKLFRESLANNRTGKNQYSFLSQTGNTCSSGVKQSLADAKVWDWQAKGFWAKLEKAGINIVLPGTVIEWAKEKGGVFYDSKSFRTDTPDTPPDTPPDTTNGGEDGDARPELVTLTSHTDDSAQPTHGDQNPLQDRFALPPDSADERAAQAAQLAAGDDRPDAPQEGKTAAWDTDDAPGDDAAGEPATDDEDEEAAQEKVILATDGDDALTDRGGAIETAKAGLVDSPAVADPAGPEPAIPAPGIPDESFSFSLFTKQFIPAEAAKEGTPAEPLSPDDIPGSGLAAGESASPETGIEEVGNAAPNKEHVVHHGDLAP